MTTTDRTGADTATFEAEMERLDRLEVADPWRDQIVDALPHRAWCRQGSWRGTTVPCTCEPARSADVDGLTAFLKPAPGTDSSRTERSDEH